VSDGGGDLCRSAAQLLAMQLLAPQLLALESCLLRGSSRLECC
jgi:hypothetical protein